MTEVQRQEAINYLKDTQTLVKYLKEQSRSDVSLHLCGDTYDDVIELVGVIVNNLGEAK